PVPRHDRPRQRPDQLPPLLIRRCTRYHNLLAKQIIHHGVDAPANIVLDHHFLPLHALHLLAGKHLPPTSQSRDPRWQSPLLRLPIRPLRSTLSRNRTNPQRVLGIRPQPRKPRPTLPHHALPLPPPPLLAP